MWLVVAGAIAVFLAAATRSAQAARTALGERFAGILVSDRYAAYTWVDAQRRQLCWAHLLRDFTRRGGAVLVLSRETIELIGLCDRIYVVHHDTIVAEMPAAQATEHKILDAALTGGSTRQH